MATPNSQQHGDAFEEQSTAESVPDNPPRDGDVSPEVVAEFEKEIAEARRLADENWDKYLRAEAELDNFKRRSQVRLQEAVERRSRSLLLEFLDVADNLERALAHSQGDPNSVIAGVEGTYKALLRVLDREGVEAIDAMEAPFDPALHEAVSVVAVPGISEERVVSVERPGYLHKSELLRPARVVVGRPTDEA